MSQIPVELWLWKQTGIFGGYLQTTLQWDPHHLQTTHPLPKIKQGRCSFFPQGWKPLPSKTVNKILPSCAINLRFLDFWHSCCHDPVGLQYHPPYPKVVCLNINTAIISSSLLSARQFVVTAPGPYWVVICQHAWDQGRDIWNISDWSLSITLTNAIFRGSKYFIDMLKVMKKSHMAISTLAMCAQLPLLSVP